MGKMQEREMWAARAAGKLRAIHASFADQSADQRRAYLEDELDYALSERESQTGETRDALLEALEMLFPVFGRVEPAVVEAAAPPPVAARVEEERGIDGMLEELGRRRGELSPAQLGRLGEILGVTASQASAAGMPAEVAERFEFPASGPELQDMARAVTQMWKDLEVAEAPATIRVTRLLKLVGILFAAYKDLRSVVWPFWRHIAPRELASRLDSQLEMAFEETVAGYLTGALGGRELQVEVEIVKRLMIGLIASTGKAAEEYGRLFNRRLSPDAIADAVALEESAGDVSRVKDLGRKCWDKYLQLARNLTADATEEEFLRVFAERMAAYVKSNA